MENKKPQKKLLPPYLMLALIALIAAVVLAATNAVTKGPIEERRMAQLMEAFGSIMPDADDYEEITVSKDYGVDSLYENTNDFTPFRNIINSIHLRNSDSRFLQSSVVVLLCFDLTAKGVIIARLMMNLFQNNVLS